MRWPRPGNDATDYFESRQKGRLKSERPEALFWLIFPTRPRGKALTTGFIYVWLSPSAALNRVTFRIRSAAERAKSLYSLARREYVLTMRGFSAVAANALNFSALCK